MSRIAALDMLRGYALVCIMLNHMPLSPLRQLTLTNFAVFDAAELFVLLSGFLVGMVWVKVEEREGLGEAQMRFLRRAVKVWLALLFGAVVMAAFSLLLFELGMNHTAIWYRYAVWIRENPIGYFFTVALMWMQPNLLDVLALYVLLLATVPLTVPVLLRWPVLFMLGSVAVWYFAVELNSRVPNQRPGQGLLFNPFGWQLLFFCGIAMGAMRKRIMQILMPFSTALTIASTALLLFSLAIVQTRGYTAGPLYDLGQVLRQISGPINKWSLDGLRLMSILAASWIVAVPLHQLFAWMAGTWMGKALGEIGRGGLWSFLVCVMMSVWGDALGMMAAPGATQYWMRIAIDIWVVVALWVAAVLWSKREEMIATLKYWLRHLTASRPEP